MDEPAAFTRNELRADLVALAPAEPDPALPGVARRNQASRGPGGS